MSRTVIGIVANVIKDGHYFFPGYPRVMINEDYSRSIEEAGAIPFLIVPSKNTEYLAEQLALLDGILLSGGEDINPALYGEQPLSKCGDPNPLRDSFELKVLEIAQAKKIPLFGICRGHQIINAFFGGSIYQDISQFNASIRHSQTANPDLPIHDVQLKPGSFVAQAMGKTTTRVNSYHHQSVKEVAPGFSVTAEALDGAVEAIQKDDPSHFVASVQWHPEMLSRSVEEARLLFKAFVAEVAQRKTT